jgi:hypothetical protein
MAKAREGDLSGYLDRFNGPFRERLDHEVAAKGREAFAEELRKAAQTRKSHAIFAPEPDGDDVMRITVESVYPDHNERQTYRLERTGSDWSVTDVETVRAVTPAAKYGTPADYFAPEGPPVES